MHASTLENMAKCYRRFVAGSPLEDKDVVEVLDVGGADVNGTYRSIFSKPNMRYRAADLQAGFGVDIVLEDPYHLPLADRSVDIVISGQMFEHCEFFWLIFREMVRVLRPGGYVFLIAPSAGPVHRYPVDCYRFNPDSYHALAQYAECMLVDSWLDGRGPWHDLVGVFSLSSSPVEASRETRGKIVEKPASTIVDVPLSNDPLAERATGREPTLDVLEEIHRGLKPRTYLEIGVLYGRSLDLARCPTVAIDPAPQLTEPPSDLVRLFECTSDEFFELHAANVLTSLVDLAYIDGMHLFEFALRDFMNVERYASPAGLVVFDDIFPNHVQQASRLRQSTVWTGDVWKVASCLRRYRPDLILLRMDTWPTGLLVVGGLDPDNGILWDHYDTIVAEYTVGELVPPPSVLTRHGAVDSGSRPFRTLLSELPPLLERGYQHREVRRHLSSTGLVRAPFFGPNPHTRATRSPALSMVIASFNMARELPRTIRSLSPAMQRGISADEYEIIVVDNGSTEPFDRAECERWGANLNVVSVEAAPPSPVAALNLGLSRARGELCGVMIDGAHLVSPGLLAGAVGAARTHPRPVISTASFHLGPDIQMRSVAFDGYDRDAEDRLLDDVDWVEDGYRLFSVSVPFGSFHRGGWYVPIMESNTLFMTNAMWKELGGYDERYQTPGGGLVSMDTYRRACELPDVQLIVLLGEGAFHQVHDGATTGARVSWNEVFVAENRRISGVLRSPRADPIFFGSIHPEAMPLVARSAEQELDGVVFPTYELPELPVAADAGGQNS